MNNFSLMYPLAAELARGSKDLPSLQIVHAGPGFDVLDLEAKLGPERFTKLMASVSQVFCCNHRSYPEKHELAGAEVHCVYVADVERFLEREGK